MQLFRKVDLLETFGMALKFVNLYPLAWGQIYLTPHQDLNPLQRALLLGLLHQELWLLRLILIPRLYSMHIHTIRKRLCTNEIILGWQIENLRLAQRLMIAITLSVDTSCALPKRLLASLCKSDFKVLLARWLSLALMTVVCDTWGNASNFTFSSCSRKMIKRQFQFVSFAERSKLNDSDLLVQVLVFFSL